MARLAPLRCSSYLRLFALDKNRKLSTVINSKEETIRPSSPTPRHLTKFKLSLLDNDTPPFYVPLIFFYPAPVRTGYDSIEILKSSLAKALTRFYPFAGRMSAFSFSGDGDEDSETTLSGSSIPIIDCNDRGVPFSVATIVDGATSMAMFLRAPEIDSLQQLLPFPAFLTTDIESAPQIAFRATVFPCGGVAVGVCVFHKIIDAHTVANFMKLWAAIARGNEPGDAYAHDQAATSLFPAHPDDAVPSAFYISEGGSVTRRFVFDGEAISALKLRCKSERVPNPSRFQAISALLWKSVMNTTATSFSPNESVHWLAAMAVNLRPRMKHQWTDYSVGNLVWGAISFCDNHQQPYSLDETMALQQLVYKLRSSIAKVDREFVDKLEGGAGRDEYLRDKEMKRKVLMEGANQGSSTSKVMTFAISTMVGMGLYDVDFGWGKPVWVSMAKFADCVRNVAILVDSPVGQGMEAWVTLHKQEMIILRHDVQFLAYAKDNPSLLEVVSARL